MFRSMFLQGSGTTNVCKTFGFLYSIIPALKQFYKPGSEEAKEALKRHMEFFNTHPYVAAPIVGGVTLALEEEIANGVEIDEAAIQGVKVGMMGPLAGIGDPVFWFTVRPIVGAIAASLATGGSIIAPPFLLRCLECNPYRFRGIHKSLVTNKVLQLQATSVEECFNKLLKVHLSLVCSSLVY